MPLTIVMYHYVRDLPRTRYPGIKGLLTSRFERQLDYICANYEVCGLKDVVAAVRGERALAERACVLTFDDGFVDHYVTVFPRLRERGLCGSFFPPARAVLESVMLDVHKIHFILERCADGRGLVRETMELIGPYREEFPEIASDDALYAQYAQANRFDPPEIIFIKRILQKGLPEPVRQAVTDELFCRYVRVEQAVLARELYMDVQQLRCMAGAGMEIGGHGYEHSWLDSQDEAGQQVEIGRTVEFLKKIGGSAPVDWTMCYPCGGYNQTTIALLKERGCALGLTTKVGVVRDLTRPWELERLDTNDVPCAGE